MEKWRDRLSQAAQNVASKSKEVAGIAKLNLENSTLNQNIKNIQTEVGAYVLEKGLLMEDSSVAEWASRVASLKAELESNSERIHDLKNVSICPGCGSEVSRESKFCPKCGTALVVKVHDQAESDSVVVDASYSDAEPKEAVEASAEEAAGSSEGEAAGTVEASAENCGEEDTSQG